MIVLGVTSLSKEERGVKRNISLNSQHVLLIFVLPETNLYLPQGAGGAGLYPGGGWGGGPAVVDTPAVVSPVDSDPEVLESVDPEVTSDDSDVLESVLEDGSCPLPPGMLKSRRIAKNEIIVGFATILKIIGLKIC